LASTVYTTRFLFLDSGALEATYVVPPKMRIIMRSLLFASFGSTDAWIQLQVHGHRVWSRAIPGGLTGESLDLLAVAYQNETVNVLTSGPDVRCMLSGYLFADPFGPETAATTGIEDEPAIDLQTAPPFVQLG
jgi:hypothetical protein